MQKLITFFFISALLIHAQAQDSHVCHQSQEIIETGFFRDAIKIKNCVDYNEWNLYRRVEGYVAECINQINYKIELPTCKIKMLNGCEYQECIQPKGSMTSYPQQVAIFYPVNAGKPTKMKIHLHGHSHFNYDWDRDFPSMIKSFKIGENTCKRNNEILIMPYSEKNQCNDFHNNLIGKNQFINFQKEIYSKLKLDQTLPLTLSGHSGGGKVIGKMLENNPNIEKLNEIELYDALYADSWYTAMPDWLKANPRAKIKMWTATTDPIKFSKNLETKVKNMNLGNQISHKIDTAKDHWGLCRDYFE